MTATPLRRQLVLVALGAMALAAGLSLWGLARNDGDVTVFLRTGTYAPARPYVEQDFPRPWLAPDYGHDGQQFYVIAGTLPHLREAEPYVDRLRYRARRILLPAVVSPVPRGAPLVWALWGVNLLAVGAAGAALAVLARRLGASPWVGAVAGVTPAFVESLDGSLADGLAVALGLWGVVCWRRRPWLAAGLFLLAALARETALVAALACLLVAPRGRRLPLLTPFIGYGAWMLAVNAWLPATGVRGSSILGDAGQQLTWPFVTWLRLGLDQPGPVLGLALLAASVVAAVLLRRSLPELAAWVAIDAVLLVCSNQAVAERPMNLARVAAVALPALVLAVAARHRGALRGAGGGVPSPVAP